MADKQTYTGAEAFDDRAWRRTLIMATIRKIGWSIFLLALAAPLGLTAYMGIHFYLRFFG